MSQMNPIEGTAFERNLEVSERNIRSKLGAAIKTVSAQTKVSVFAVALGFANVVQAEDSPLGHEVGCEGGAQLASYDAKGAPCIDLSLSASEIQTKISALEERENLSNTEKRLLYSLKKELLEIERTVQVENEAVIDAENRKQEINEQAIKNLEEIKAAING